MTGEELFAIVKPNVNGVTPASDFYDSKIKFLINEVLGFMESAGIPESAVTAKTAGIVTIGVNDLFDLPSGTIKFSPYFYQRITQLEAKASKEKKEAAASV